MKLIAKENTRGMLASILMSLAALPVAFGFVAIATSVPAAESSTEFFNRVAGRILQDRLQLNLSRLEVFPSNHLSSEARRLLQVTANLWDASQRSKSGESQPFFPTVFQPVFLTEGPALYITGYAELNSPWFHERLLNGDAQWMTLGEWVESAYVRSDSSNEPMTDSLFDLPPGREKLSNCKDHRIS